MRESADDSVGVEIFSAILDITAVQLEPLVVGGRDVEAEDVNRLRLTTEARGQLLGDEHVGAIGDLDHTIDRVVVGDRHEVHPATLGQLVDLLRWRGALRQTHRSLHAKPRLLRGGGVTVHVDPCGWLVRRDRPPHP